MTNNEEQYLSLLVDVLENGEERGDRTGTGTLSLFGPELTYDLTESFPLFTTKRVWFRGLALEMLWFISGSTNIRPLLEEGVSIWTDWPLKKHNQWREKLGAEPLPAEDFEEKILADEEFASENGDLGPVYGKQWRDFEGVGAHADQLAGLVEGLQENPESRRHIVSAWHAADTPMMALPPCHLLFQCYVRGSGHLDLKLYIRSNDLLIGHPFNCAQYALLVHMLADQTGLKPGKLTVTMGDAHVYANHLEQVREQLSRPSKAGPQLRIVREAQTIDDYSLGHFQVEGYEHHPAIEAPVAV